MPVRTGYKPQLLHEISQLAEIKASRDILVHNKGVANAVYVAKAGTRARYKDGERLEIPEHYHRESWEAIRKVIHDVSDAVHRKLQGSRKGESDE